MKMLLIIYSQESDEYVLNCFNSAGIKYYTKMRKIEGVGKESEPKLGSHAWPGENNILFIAADEEETIKAVEMVRTIKKEKPRAGIRCFVLPMEECVQMAKQINTNRQKDVSRVVREKKQLTPDKIKSVKKKENGK